MIKGMAPFAVRSWLLNPPRRGSSPVSGDVGLRLSIWLKKWRTRPNP